MYKVRKARGVGRHKSGQSRGRVLDIYVMLEILSTNTKVTDCSGLKNLNICFCIES